MFADENFHFQKWETCIAANTKIKLPQDLCEHAAIFKEFLDYPYIWNECLTESQRETLCNLLPVFPKDCDVEAETEKTLRMLFERENHRLGRINHQHVLKSKVSFLFLCILFIFNLPVLDSAWHLWTHFTVTCLLVITDRTSEECAAWFAKRSREDCCSRSGNDLTSWPVNY